MLFNLEGGNGVAAAKTVRLPMPTGIPTFSFALAFAAIGEGEISNLQEENLLWRSAF
jgi:hypothetical protein